MAPPPSGRDLSPRRAHSGWRRFWARLRGVHARPQYASGAGGNRPTVAIVGSPNVGKSVVFNRLTGAYVTVSNYPGTTVEVARGKVRLPGREVEVIDTPGLYSLAPLSEEERVAQRILLHELPDVIVHVADAKNLDRMVPLTLQLRELGRPLILVVNLLDEARRVGLEVDLGELERRLHVPVVGAIAIRNVGVQELKEKLDALLRDRTDEHAGR